MALREIHLTGQTTQNILARQFIEKEIIVDVEGNLNVTSKGRSLLVRVLHRCGKCNITKLRFLLS